MNFKANNKKGQLGHSLNQFEAGETTPFNFDSLPSYEESQTNTLQSEPSTSTHTIIPIEDNHPPLDPSVVINITNEGVTSKDSILNTDFESCKSYFLNYNLKPSLKVKIEGNSYLICEFKFIFNYLGYHTTMNTTRDNEGNITSENETRHEDFKLEFDVTQFIESRSKLSNPFKPEPLNYIYNNIFENSINEYISSNKILKTLILEKEVQWDYNVISSTIRDEIRNLGYNNNVNVYFELLNSSISLRQDNLASNVLFEDRYFGFFTLSELLFALLINLNLYYNNNEFNMGFNIIITLFILFFTSLFSYFLLKGIRNLVNRYYGVKLISSFPMGITPQDWFSRIRTQIRV